MPEIYTIGHSTRSLEEFIQLLQEFQIRRLVDVRTIPRSRRNPQFNKESLPQALRAAGVEYTHIPGLGGLRKAQKDSINTAWENDSFRGYADYMQTPEFSAGLEELISLSQDGPIAIMCAEAVPWRCHRSLIGDALLARGYSVIDILGPNSARPHKLTSFAVVEGERVTYPKDQSKNL